MNVGAKVWRARTSVFGLVLTVAGLWSGGVLAQTSAGAIADGRGRVVALAAGSDATCALNHRAAAQCWGNNWFGTLTPPTGQFHGRDDG